MTTNRAIVYDDYGPPEQLHVREVPLPEASGKQCLIRVRYASINPIDTRIRSGEMKGLLPGGFPRVPGYDVAGEVVQADSEGRFPIGTQVLAFLDSVYGGAYAQYAACGVDAMAALPPDMPLADAAALPLAGTTALQALRDHGRLQRGERVLINGASGGVGAFAVQIARILGATPDAVASESNASFCHELGAERFYDYQRTDFTDIVDRWDVVFDAAGKSSYLAARDCLTEGGRFVSTEPDAKGWLMTLLTMPLDKTGKAMLAKPRHKDLQTLVEYYTQGQLRVVLADVLPLEQAAEAHRQLEEGLERGKLVLQVP